MLRVLGSVSCDIAYETGLTICYGHWNLHPVISHTKQGVRFVTALASYHTRDRGYDWLRALGSASGDITQETGATSLVISHTRQEVTIYYGHWVLRLVISHTR